VEGAVSVAGASTPTTQSVMGTYTGHLSHTFLSCIVSEQDV